MTMRLSRVGSRLSLAAALGTIALAALAPTASARARTVITSPARIEKLAANAYLWGVAPEFVYRFANYNELITAPRNHFGGPSAVGAWNNQATNAGNATALYLDASLDLSGQAGRGGVKQLVLTVPASQRRYILVALQDAFLNTVGSIGTRTTPSHRAQTYLLAGPTSPYAHRRFVRIHGFTYRVMTFGTDIASILIRIRADSLAPAGAPTSVPSMVRTVEARFALNTLAQFQAHGNRPTYYQPGSYTPTPEQIRRAARWHSAPTKAVAFFKQLGQALKLSPLPTARTGLNGTPLKLLPPWVVPQSNAKHLYRNPAYGQRTTLALFRPLGLTADGFRIPRRWGPAQLKALQSGYEAGQANINQRLASGGSLATAETNWWGYLNSDIGTYRNTPQGYLHRALLTVGGGGANIPQDDVYAQINNTDGTPSTQLTGNGTYELTFTPPVTNPPTLPVTGTLPPTVNDRQGNPRAFWSITAYQPDTQQSAAPFITQASVLNTAYSRANVAVTAVDASTDTITVRPSGWGPLEASTPILFGSTAARYGLKADVPYYVATAPTSHAGTNGTVYSFKVSAIWRQQLSGDDVPIQGNTGTPGPIAPLTNPGGPIDLRWGPIQPVSQLGSQQLTSGKLVKNADGSVTIWLAPTLPPGAPATNWIPTPSSAYYNSIYGINVVPLIRPIMRIYYPTPGSDSQASILPPPNGKMRATYTFPAMQQMP
jgi:hypothetical protein